MRLGRFVGAALLATVLAAGGAAGRPAPAASDEPNHAAVVIDTGDGKVRKFCLAFPEESISGVEALRRIDADPVFASYGSKGEAVCALCGVGCPSSNCFCDGSKFWAYHRAGPGGEKYTASRVGASSTEVRDGDVEGWRWGSGEAPPPATVSEVCDVPEPPARTSSSATTSPSTTAPPATTTTTAPPAPADEVPAPARADATTWAGGGGSAPAPAPAVTPPPTVEAGATEDPSAPAAGDAGGADDAVTDTRSGDDLSAAAPTGNTRGPDAGGGVGGAAGLVAFVVVLGAVLGWRVRLRRADVRH